MFQYLINYVNPSKPVPIPQNYGSIDGFHVLSSTIITGEARLSLCKQ